MTMTAYTEIKHCRICNSSDLVSILDLGIQSLTGVFPRNKEESDKLTKGPLELVKCMGGCGLVQLRHTYESTEMYGSNYGYRSGLNQSMVQHLQNKAGNIVRRVLPQKGDLILDIGSNDSTLLQAYGDKGYDLIGIDPTGKKFQHYYPPHIRLIPDFFSSQAFKAQYGSRKAKIITSIAMLYDLENPIDFLRQVREIIADDGVWVFEQSYLPTMLDVNAYDTVCHEHLEYYCLRQIEWMMNCTGFDLVDVELNAVNGGSFSVMVTPKDNSTIVRNHDAISRVHNKEAQLNMETLTPYSAFRQRVFNHRDALQSKLYEIKTKSQQVAGLGASTKGNVILQFCGFSRNDLPCIGEVNPDKFGAYTPGTFIPIVSEQEVRAIKPEYLMILPWHFRDTFLSREREHLARGGKLIFPLPEIEVVSS